MSPGPGAAAVRQRELALTTGSLFLAGATLGVLSLLLPHSPRADEAALALIVAIAYAAGALILLAGTRIPSWLVHTAVAFGTVLVSLAISFSGEPTSAYAVMLIWIVLFTSYFFPGRPAAAHLGLVGLAYGAAMLAHAGQGNDLLARWLITIVALGVVAVLMSHLVLTRRRYERDRDHLAALVEASAEAIIGASRRGTIESWNRGAEGLLGHSALAAVGRPLSLLAPPDHHAELDELLERLARGSEIDGHETVWLHENGDAVHVSLTLAPVKHGGGEMTGVSIVARDIAERKHVEELSERLLAESETRARTDPLTGLANRRAWDEELRRELARAARSGWPVCVAMLDLDRFKAFNDEQGHLAGDELLREAAAIWRVVLRGGDFIARYGGEEFGVLLPNCSIGDAAQVVERLRITTPMGQTCSAGVACWDGSESAGTLLRRADGALYSAKRSGRDRMLSA